MNEENLGPTDIKGDNSREIIFVLWVSIVI